MACNIHVIYLQFIAVLGTFLVYTPLQLIKVVLWKKLTVQVFEVPIFYSLKLILL